VRMLVAQKFTSSDERAHEAVPPFFVSTPRPTRVARNFGLAQPPPDQAVQLPWALTTRLQWESGSKLAPFQLPRQGLLTD
jgi:hypothetical protein